jgi:hypothetical protein
MVISFATVSPASRSIQIHAPALRRPLAQKLLQLCGPLLVAVHGRHRRRELGRESCSASARPSGIAIKLPGFDSRLNAAKARKADFCICWCFSCSCLTALSLSFSFRVEVKMSAAESSSAGV